PRFRGRLEHRLSEHVPSILHGLRRNGVQCRPQPWAGRHLVRARLVEVQVEPVASCPYSESRPVRPPLDEQPLDGPVGMPLPWVAWSAGVPRCPPPSFFTNALGRHTGRPGHGGPLATLPHLAELAENGLGPLHLETNFHDPSLLHRRAYQLHHLAPVVGTDDVVAASLVTQSSLI